MLRKKILLILLIAFGVSSTGLATDRYLPESAASQASGIATKSLDTATGYQCFWVGMWYCF